MIIMGAAYNGAARFRQRSHAFRLITEIIRGERDVSADTAIRLGRYFGTDPRFWLNLQAAHDLSVAESGHDYSKIGRRRAA
jgi:plasmid maintenance system antidote protein VapI